MGGLRRVPTSRMPAIESPSMSSLTAVSAAQMLSQSSGEQALAALAGGASVEMAGGADGGGPASLAQEDVAVLEEGVASNFLFDAMSDQERMTVFHAMQRLNVQAGQLIVRQGDPGDHFFVVASGLYDVYVQQQPTSRPELVHTYGTLWGEGTRNSNGSSVTPQEQHRASFGEIALLYSKPRAASVVARTEGQLWSLHRSHYKAAMQLAAERRAGARDVRALVQTLRGVEVLQCLTGSQLHTMAEVMEEMVVEDGHHIIRQGEEGREFFLITRGEVVCTVRKNPEDEAEVPKVRGVGGGYRYTRVQMHKGIEAPTSNTHTCTNINRGGGNLCAPWCVFCLAQGSSCWPPHLARMPPVMCHLSMVADCLWVLVHFAAFVPLFPSSTHSPLPLPFPLHPLHTH